MEQIMPVLARLCDRMRVLLQGGLSGPDEQLVAIGEELRPFPQLAKVAAYIDKAAGPVELLNLLLVTRQIAGGMAQPQYPDGAFDAPPTRTEPPRWIASRVPFR